MFSSSPTYLQINLGLKNWKQKSTAYIQSLTPYSASARSPLIINTSGFNNSHATLLFKFLLALITHSDTSELPLAFAIQSISICFGS